MGNLNEQIRLPLLLLRVGVFIVMFMWTLDKFVNPEHAQKVFANFYFISGVGDTILYVLAAIEMLILLCFLAGIQKRFSYGAVLIFHAVSTLSSFKVYLAPFDGPGLLFFAAWPMLAACYALFALREYDTLGTVSKLG